MHINAKPCQLASYQLQYALEALSKAALIDLVVDLTRRYEGADVPEEQLLAAIAETYLPPVLRVREDDDPRLALRFHRASSHTAKSEGP